MLVYSLFLHWKLRRNHNPDITFSLCRAFMDITSDETVMRNVFIPFVLPTNLVNALSYKPSRGENRIHSIHSFIHLPGVFNSPLLHRIVRMHVHRAIRIVPRDQAPPLHTCHLLQEILSATSTTGGDSTLMVRNSREDLEFRLQILA